MPKPSVKKVMVDIDGVCADFVKSFTELGAELFGTPVIQTGDHASWGFEDIMNRKQINAIWEKVKNSLDFWEGTACLLSREDIDVLHSNYLKHDLVFATSRVGCRVVYQTSTWMQNHLNLAHPSILVSSKKGDIARAIGAEFSIEDKVENAWMIHWLTDGKTKSYLLDRPYNRVGDNPSFGAHAVKRVNTLSEFFAAVNETS